MKRAIIPLLMCAVWAATQMVDLPRSRTAFAAQRRQKKRVPSPKSPPTPRGAASKYSHFLHSSEKHKATACNTCHKIPTRWTAKRDFPDVADFPDHLACVSCHRQQFFTGQAFAGTGPVICTVCHLKAAPREDARFSFGKPNNASQTAKPNDERQFRIEFPHDKHQNAIAWFLNPASEPGVVTRQAVWKPEGENGARFSTAGLNQSGSLVPARFNHPQDQRADYNNCTICHAPVMKTVSVPGAGWPDSFVPPAGTFKSQPTAHDSCFGCHWQGQKPTHDDCGGCHKAIAAFNFMSSPKRISVKFNHEGGKTHHYGECTTCHINITRAGTTQGLGPDVPIFKCATCHKDSETITYGKTIGTIDGELAQFAKTGSCTYCHTSDVGKKKAPPTHAAAVE